jgi:hypothetical protein
VFQWITGSYIDKNSSLWGFKKQPEDDTCVWLLQLSVYNYTWANYDCTQATGFICEIDLKEKLKPVQLPNFDQPKN